MKGAAAHGELHLAHPSPLYERATGAILELIAQNGYRPGDRLPGESVLASELGISRPTLREALMELKNQGVIDRRHGVGTFVAEPPPSALHGGIEELKSLRDLSLRTDVDLVRSHWDVGLVDAPEEVHLSLHLPSEAAVVRVCSAASVEGVQCARLESYIAEEHVDLEELREYRAGSLLDYLMEQASPRVAYTNSDIFATTAQGPAARRLGVPDGAPVLHLREVFFTSAGEPVLFSLNDFRTEIISFHLVRKVVS